MALLTDLRASHPFTSSISAALAVALLTGCPGKGEGDETGDDPTGASETTSGSAGDTGSATDTADTDDEPSPVCTEMQPGVSAAFEFSRLGVMACTVDAVSVEAAMIVTELTCDTPDGPAPTTLTMAEAPEGPPAWAAGDAVTLQNTDLGDIGFTWEWRQLILRRAADSSLLAAGIRHDTVASEWIAPIVFEASYPCGGPDGPALEGDEKPYQLGFSLADQTLALLPFHRGLLPIDATEGFAIDVEAAVTDACCDYESGHWQHLLIRRVRTP